MHLQKEDTGAWIGERQGFPIDREADRVHQADELDRFFKLSGLYDAFSTDLNQQERLTNFLSVDNKEIINRLTRVNGILRNMPFEIRGFSQDAQYIGTKADDDNPSIDFIPCFSEDKESMLEVLLDAVRNIKEPQIAATLLGFGINNIHPYGDGNGRIARLAYNSIVHGFRKDGDKMKQLVGENGDKMIDLSGGFYFQAVFNMLKMDSPSFDSRVDANGVLQTTPLVIPALFDGSKPVFTDKDNFDDPEVKKRATLFTIFLEKNMAEFIASGMKRDMDNGLINVPRNKLFINSGGREYFLFDNFLREASLADIDRALAFVGRIAKLFTRRFIKEAVKPHNQQPSIGLSTKEYGVMMLRFTELGALIAEKTVTPVELPN